MDDFERRVAVLLRDAVPEPEHEISPAAVARQGRRRRMVTLAVPVAAAVALAVATVLVLALTPWRTSDHAQPATPPPHKAVQLGSLTFSYPASWQTADVSGLGAGLGSSGPQVADDPVRILSSRPIVHVCSSPRRAVIGSCVQSVRRLGPDSVLVGINTFHPDEQSVLLNRKVAGRPAAIVNRAGVDAFCPAGTQSTRHVTISLGGGDYLSLLGCLGSSPTSSRAFDAFVNSAH